jgi:hypothetical protein
METGIRAAPNGIYCLLVVENSGLRAGIVRIHN